MFLKIPSLILKQLYTFGSLANTSEGVRLTLKNRLSDATVTRISSITIDGVEASHSGIEIDLGDDERLRAAAISKSSALAFPLKKSVVLHLVGFGPLATGNHEVVVKFEATPFGELDLKVTDAIAEEIHKRVQIPYDKQDDHNQRMAEVRQAFVAELQRQETRARQSLLLRPGGDARQHREFRRRGPDSDRSRGPVASQRRARPGRVSDSARDHRRNARRLLQPRDEGPQSGRRRQVARWSTTPCSAHRSSSSTTRATRATSRSGSTTT